MYRKGMQVIVNGIQGVVQWTSSQGVYVSVNGINKYFQEHELSPLF